METPPLNRIVHTKLQEHIQNSGLTVNKVAAKAGVPASTLRRQIKCENYTMPVLDRLCRVFDEPVHHLFRVNL